MRKRLCIVRHGAIGVHLFIGITKRECFSAPSCTAVTDPDTQQTNSAMVRRAHGDLDDQQAALVQRPPLNNGSQSRLDIVRRAEADAVLYTKVNATIG